MIKKFFKKTNNEQKVRVTYKHDNDTATTTETMTKSMLAGMVVNDSYIEVIEVVEI